MRQIDARNYFKLLHRLDVALDSLTNFICTRPCCNWRASEEGPGPGNFEDVFWSHHSYAGLSKHIWDGKRLTDKEISLYENDIEHGVLHGISTYLAASISEPKISDRLVKRIRASFDSNSRKIEGDPYDHSIANDYYNNPTADEKLVPCCLFHDMYKCINPVDTHSHDTNLREYFPGLDEVVYRHSAPVDTDTSHPLVKGDRLELLRYDNADDWVKYDKIFNNVDDDTKELLLFFYERVRPVLQKSFKHRDERWVRHGIEDHIREYDFSSTMYPVLSSLENGGLYDLMVNSAEGETYWAVELAKGSLGSCITRKKGHLHQTICKQGHMGKAWEAWELLQGKMPLKEYNQPLNSCKVRDHLYGKGQRPMSDWIFTHKDTPHRNIQPVLDADLYICHDKIVYKLLHLAEKIIDVLYGVKFRNEVQS